jgi:hypothetical protein
MENIFLKIEFFSLFGYIKKNVFFIKRLFFNYGFFNDSNKIREITMCMIKLVVVVIYDNSINDCNIYDTINVGGNGIVIK